MKHIVTTLASPSYLVLVGVALFGATGCGGGAAISAVEAAQLWNVSTGGSEQSGAIQALDFYPNSITIHSGDTVAWSNPNTI
ncbi:MAG: hypothetical protein ACREQC_07590, partial [Candidatus Binataceae bacterium]